jgi:DNA repair protein RecO (recombination protein O)
MGPELLRAVVLRTRPFSETSLWVRLYSESRGKLTGIAKGARRGTERIYTPFLEVEAGGYPPRAAEHGLWTLARPEIARDWRDLVADPDRLPYAFSLLEVVDLTVEEMHQHPELYSALTLSLERMNEGPPSGAPAVLVWFLLRLSGELGYALQHEICPRCGRPLVFPVGALVSAAGGVVCKSCSPPSAAPVPRAAWECLVTLAAAEEPGAVSVDAKTRDLLLSLLLDFLGYHSQRPVRLRSLGLAAGASGREA